MTALYIEIYRKEIRSMFLEGASEAALTAATGAEVSSVLEVLGQVFSFIINSLTTIVEVVMANPLLLIPIGVVLTYTIIRVFKSLF